METGLVLGKFNPPHLGHLYLIQYAEKRSPGGVIVVVGSLPTETIPAKLRCKWLRRLVGKRTIVLDIPDDTPANVSSKDEEYWTTWRDNLTHHLLYLPTTIFGSEEYVKKLASYLGRKALIVDKDRTQVPISATMIRNDPLKNWKYIPDVVKPYYRDLLKLKQKSS